MSINLETKGIFAKTARMSHPYKISTSALEAEWLEIQAAQKDPAAFRPLYNRYYEPIFHFVYRRVGDEVVTSQVCSNIFFKAIKKLPDYKYRGVPFSAWLFRLATNEVNQYYRDQKKTRVVSIQDTQLGQLIDDSGSNDKTQQIELLVKALDQLKDKDLNFIELRYFEDRPYKEVADILGIKESNAKMATYRALEKLKKIMERLS